MLVAPAATPVTIPDALTVATAVTLLDHVPPAGDELNVEVEPTHSVVEPVMADGAELTLTTVVLVQPDVNRNVIVVVPVLIAVTTPDILPIVATDVLLLIHEVPTMLSNNVVVPPTQRVVTPVIGVVAAFTLIVVVLKQPVASV